jgi:hypothetical protein
MELVGYGILEEIGLEWNLEWRNIQVEIRMN